MNKTEKDTEQDIEYIATIYNSITDSYGNRYFAMRIVRVHDGAEAVLNLGGCASGEAERIFNNLITHGGDHERKSKFGRIEKDEMTLAEFNLLTTEWPFMRADGVYEIQRQLSRYGK